MIRSDIDAHLDKIRSAYIACVLLLKDAKRHLGYVKRDAELLTQTGALPPGLVGVDALEQSTHHLAREANGRVDDVDDAWSDIDDALAILGKRGD
jgi:hypothetical protein